MLDKGGTKSLEDVCNEQGTQIQDRSSKDEWYDDPSELNPADILSRGTSVRSSLWCNGPLYLLKRKDNWPKNEREHRNVDELCTNELQNALKILVRKVQFEKDIFIFRPIIFELQKIRRPVPPKTRSQYIYASTSGYVLYLCSLFATREIDNLRKGKKFTASKIVPLNPFMDEDGLLRVRGRLSHFTCKYEKKHLYSTVQFTQFKFWPIHGKSTVKGVMRECVTYLRTQQKSEGPIMGGLPSERTKPARRFMTVGVDFAGPIMIKYGTFRNRQMVKPYVCLFVCFATKAVQLKLASNLSAKIFFNCLKRFVALRGLYKLIYCDNATDFCGARNELEKDIIRIRQSVTQPEFRDFLLKNEISWKFIPPRLPHYGGSRGHLETN
nr:unnamed protein product [Callosobruchus analis]